MLVISYMPTEYAYSVVCDIGGYEFVSYSQGCLYRVYSAAVVCDIGGYEFVSYSQVGVGNGYRPGGCL